MAHRRLLGREDDPGHTTDHIATRSGGQGGGVPQFSLSRLCV